MEQILADAEELDRAQPMLGRIHLITPILIVIGLYVVLGYLDVWDKFTLAGLAALPLGKFIVLGGAADIGLNQWELALMVVFMDTWAAYVLAYNLHHLYKVPRLGPWLHNVQNYCRYWLHEYPLMRRWAITGVVLFVVVPLSGTGAPGGALLGRIVGLRPRTILAAVFTGSILGCGIMVAFAAQISSSFAEVQGEWWFRAIGISILAILLIVLWRLGVHISRAANQFAVTQTERSQAESTKR
jgi:uncharacterized membrane protein